MLFIFQSEAFEELRDHYEFMKVSNGEYLIEWRCGADLSSDNIEVRWQVVGDDSVKAMA
jgi:hypothetical protein